jgi:predicted Zn-dependent protease
MPNRDRFHAGCSVVGLALLIFATGCATDRKVIDQAEGFDTGLKPAEISDREINGYFQRLGDRIVAAARQSDQAGWGPKAHFDKSEKDDWMFKGIQFHLVNSKTLNAFTTGGEHVYIYNELFQMCKDEDDLAAVMAHEFGHIYSRHVQKGTNRQMGVIAAALGVGAAGYAYGGKEHGGEYASAGAALGMMGGTFFNKGFTRGDEAQADECGFHFYCLAGWDPNKFGNFFQTMIDKGYDKTPAITSDHPTLASRVKIARERASTLPDLPGNIAALRKPESASVGQFTHYQEQARRAAQSTPDDQHLQQTQQLLAAVTRGCLAPDPTPPDQQAARKGLEDALTKQQQAGSDGKK